MVEMTGHAKKTKGAAATLMCNEQELA